MKVAQIRFKNIRFHMICAVYTSMKKTDLEQKSRIWATSVCSVNVAIDKKLRHKTKINKPKGKQRIFMKRLINRN